MLAEQQVAIVRVMEEASELQKECAKALRFGLSNRYPAKGLTNAEKIVAEFRDVESALMDAGVIGVRGLDVDHKAAKREARRIVDEYPKLIQPSETAYNLARAYLAAVGGLHGR